MFLLNFESEVPVSDEDINLQYKMFLLNKEVIFGDCLRYAIYNTKCFY